MTDRELLELAAKAAGIVIDYSHESVFGGRKTGFDLVGNAVLDWHNGKTWNPLTDDGDALRLVMKLRLTVGVGLSGSSVSDVSRNPLAVNMHGDDPYAATRRAIVRAAAEIGKGL